MNALWRVILRSFSEGGLASAGSARRKLCGGATAFSRGAPLEIVRIFVLTGPGTGVTLKYNFIKEDKHAFRGRERA